MSKKSTSATFDEDAPITQADIKSGKLVLRKRGATGTILPSKQRVNIYLDSAIIEHFNSKAMHRSAVVIEGNGSRVRFELAEVVATFHRPHPEKEAKRYQVRDASEFLIKAGITP